MSSPKSPLYVYGIVGWTSTGKTFLAWCLYFLLKTIGVHAIICDAEEQRIKPFNGLGAEITKALKTLKDHEGPCAIIVTSVRAKDLHQQSITQKKITPKIIFITAPLTTATQDALKRRFETRGDHHPTHHPDWMPFEGSKVPATFEDMLSAHWKDHMPPAEALQICLRFSEDKRTALQKFLGAANIPQLSNLPEIILDQAVAYANEHEKSIHYTPSPEAIHLMYRTTITTFASLSVEPISKIFSEFRDLVKQLLARTDSISISEAPLKANQALARIQSLVTDAGESPTGAILGPKASPAVYGIPRNIHQSGVVQTSKEAIAFFDSLLVTPPPTPLQIEKIMMAAEYINSLLRREVEVHRFTQQLDAANREAYYIGKSAESLKPFIDTLPAKSDSMCITIPAFIAEASAQIASVSMASSATDKDSVLKNWRIVSAISQKNISQETTLRKFIITLKSMYDKADSLALPNSDDMIKRSYTREQECIIKIAHDYLTRAITLATSVKPLAAALESQWHVLATRRAIIERDRAAAVAAAEAAAAVAAVAAAEAAAAAEQAAIDAAFLAPPVARAAPPSRFCCIC